MRSAIKQSILTITALLLFVGAASAATIVVSAGGNLQAAVNNAQRGDLIIVEAGASFRGPIDLPAKPGTAEIVIQSSRASELPNGRVGPAHSALMPKILCPAFEQAIRTKPGASFYTFVGIEVMPDPSVVEDPNVIKFFDLIRFGDSRGAQTTLASVPHHLKIDRSYIHGFQTSSFQRGLSLNSSDSEVTRSYFSDIHGLGFDSQAICSWNTPGRNKVVDNYLEAGSEIILLGGSDPASADFIPTGDYIARNNLFRPLTYKGKGWAVKNLLELKNAKGTVITGNVFENNWTDGQSGIAILFTVRNQDCTAPFSTIQNITFTYNTVKNAEGVFNFLGKDNEAEPGYLENGKPKCGDPGESFGSVRGSGFASSHNLFYDIRGPFITLNGFDNVSIDRATNLQSANLTTVYGQPSQGFRYTNNLTFDHQYGLWIEGGKKAGDPNGLLPGAVIEGNVIVAPYDKSSWPANNEFLATLTLPADFRSPIAGKGADIDQLSAAQKGSGPVTTPTPSPTPTPTPSPSPSPSPSPVPSPSPAPTPKPIVYEWLRINYANETQLETALRSAGLQGYSSCVPGPSGKAVYCSRVKQ